MRALLRLFLDIALLSGRPQDLPASRALPVVTGVLALATNYAVDTGFAHNLQRLGFAAAQTLILGAWVGLFLAIRRFWVRYGQTMTAVYGSNVVVNLVTWPLALAHGIGPLGSEILAIALAVWFVAIVTKILWHALELSLPLSALLTVTGTFASGWILISLFPLPKA